MREVLTLPNKPFARYALDAWSDSAVQQRLRDTLGENMPDKEKLRKLMGLLPPGVNIMAYYTQREGGQPMDETLADLKQLHGFCLRRGRTLWDYKGEEKPPGFLTLIRPVDNRITGNVHFGDTGWMRYPAIKQTEAGMGYLYDIFCGRRGSMNFREDKHPGALKMFLHMFHRAIHDELDHAFDLPRLRVVIPRSRHEMRIWEGEVFQRFLLNVVRTRRWGIASLAGETHVRADCTAEYANGQYTIKSEDGVETVAKADVEFHIEKEIKDVFGDEALIEIEPLYSPGVKHTLRMGDTLWRPANTKLISDESETERDPAFVISRLKCIGVDECTRKKNFRSITRWAALTTMIDHGLIKTLDGTFLSSLSAPRVQAMDSPCVFMTFGREAELRNGPPPYPYQPFTRIEQAKWKEDWMKANLFLMNFVAVSKKPVTAKGGKVRFSPVGKVNPATA